MKRFICFIICIIFIGCGIYPYDNLIVIKKNKNGNKCNYIITAENIGHTKELVLRNYPCDCFDVGDTLDIILKEKGN